MKNNSVTAFNSVLNEDANREIFTSKSKITALLLSDDQTTLWVGSEGGLEERNAHNGQLKRVYTDQDRLSSKSIKAFVSDGSGGIWVL
ncbi:MAG: hypothetical protein U9N81_13825 [Bacillota bacterium]|nr:hypothetical protein [Bacillota bacterium]